ncbi:MAG: hypothetical protein H6581_14415 [Bacteroidia bacterium]|nr:hypothetical protein [Bacteroidia bacterium]
MFENRPIIQRFTFPWKVWKVLPDEVSGFLAVECRQGNPQKMGIGLVNPESEGGEVEVFEPQNGWYSGLMDFYQGHFVVFEYDDHSLPMGTGLYVFRGIASGKETGIREVWRETGVDFVGITDQGIFGRIENQPFRGGEEGNSILFDLNSGKILQKLSQKESEDLSDRIQHFIQEKRMPARRYPQRTFQGEEKFAEFAAEIELRGLGLPFGQVEFLETRGREIRCYFLKDANGLLQQWFELRQEGKLILQELLAADLEKMTLESFFEFNGSLVLLAGERQLGILKLGSGN